MWSHNPKVTGSNPVPATNWKALKHCVSGSFVLSGSKGCETKFHPSSTVGLVSGSATWHTAPEDSPITIPPCQQVDQQSPATYIVPNLAPGNYQLCLTRESEACAPFEIIT